MKANIPSSAPGSGCTINIAVCARTKSRIRDKIAVAQLAARNLAECVADSGDAFARYCGQALDNGAAIRAHISDPADYFIIRDYWEALPPDSRMAMQIALDDGGAERNEHKPTNMIIDLDAHPQLALQNKMEAASRHAPGEPWGVLCPTAPLYWPSWLKILHLAADPADDLFNFLSLVEVNRNSQIVFCVGPASDLWKKIDRDFWKLILTTHLPAQILSCDDRLECAPFRMWNQDAGEIRTLFIFPERMLPVRRAFFLRGLDMCLGLNYGAEPTAVLVLGPRNEDLKRIKSCLEIFAPYVHAAPLTRGSPPWPHRLIHKMELFCRKYAGCNAPPPLRFSTRCFRARSRQTSQALLTAVEHLPKLENVIYTGAWFTEVIFPLKKRRPHLQLYCDTHDVFHIMDHDCNKNERRFFYSPGLQKKLEIELLAKADAIIAISGSDQESLKNALPDKKILTESGSFSYTIKKLSRLRAPKNPLFGFIGSNNDNNVKCLNIIKNHWWPTIEKAWPGATLSISGAICQAKEAEELRGLFPASVSLLGFVDSLNAYYASVKAMLAPICVQGGLNFKSVESLMAGRPLITNALGAKCIGMDQKGVFIVGTKGEGLEDMVAALKRFTLHTHRAIHRAAAKRFGNDAAYRNLLGTLHAGQPPPR